MYCRKLRVRSSGVFGRLMNLGGSLARHSGSPLLKTLSMTFPTLSGLSAMMKVARRSCLPHTSRALRTGGAMGDSIIPGLSAEPRIAHDELK